MSACLSVTSITCDDTRLNAPIAMISDSRIAITVFSIFSARNRLALSWVQSLTRNGPCSLVARSRPTTKAWSMSCNLRRTPVTPPPIRSRRCRSCRLTTARPLSNSL